MSTEFDPIRAATWRVDEKAVALVRYVELAPGNGTLYRVSISDVPDPARRHLGFAINDYVVMVAIIGHRAYPFRSGNGDVLAWSYLKEKLGLNDGDRAVLGPIAELLGRTPHPEAA